MLATDEDSLVCDFAETYGIYDLSVVPVKTRATLASGLRDTSRIKSRLAGVTVIPLEISTAKAADELTAIRYVLAHSKGEAAPRFFADVMYDKKDTEYIGFETGADFDRARRAYFEKVNRNG